MANKTCELDPVATDIVKTALDVLLPSLTKLANKSLTSGRMPSHFKTAVITPLLKKAKADLVLKNYRPVSNLPFLSKVLEKIVVDQLTTYKNENQLGESLQSAYKKYHCTESALLKVYNDLLMEMDTKM